MWIIIKMRNITSFPPGRKISSHGSALRTPPVGSAGKAPKKTNTQPNPSAPERDVYKRQACNILLRPQLLHTFQIQRQCPYGRCTGKCKQDCRQHPLKELNRAQSAHRLHRQRIHNHHVQNIRRIRHQKHRCQIPQYLSLIHISASRLDAFSVYPFHT